MPIAHSAPVLTVCSVMIGNFFVPFFCLFVSVKSQLELLLDESMPYSGEDELFAKLMGDAIV